MFNRSQVNIGVEITAKIRVLRRIPAFAHCVYPTVAAAASQAQIITLPAGRCVVTAGHPAQLYLLRGVLQTRAPDRRWSADGEGVLQPFFPGCRSAHTISTVQVLRLAMPLPQQAISSPELAEGRTALPAAVPLRIPPWLRVFLASPLLRRLTPAQWQRLVAALRPLQVPAGRPVLAAGRPGRYCFVVESGQAVVHRGAQVLQRLHPGSFFAEEALVLGDVRNADVTAIQPLRLQALDAFTFTQGLLAPLLCLPPSSQPLPILDLRSLGDSAVRVSSQVRRLGARLRAERRYRVVGRSRRERMLAVMLLAQQGICAEVVTRSDGRAVGEVSDVDRLSDEPVA